MVGFDFLALHKKSDANFDTVISKKAKTLLSARLFTDKIKKGSLTVSLGVKTAALSSEHWFESNTITNNLSEG